MKQWKVLPLTLMPLPILSFNGQIYSYLRPAVGAALLLSVGV